MADENIIKDILAYLKKYGPTNTFRLARKIGLERYKLLDILKRLEEKQAIRIECGNVIFVKFISEEKPKPIKIKESSPKSKKKVKFKVKRKPAKSKTLQLLQAENKQFKEKLLELEGTLKRLEKKVSATPKTIAKTIIKRVPVTKTVVKKIPVSPISPHPKRQKKAKKRKKIQKKKNKKKPKKSSKKFKFPKLNLIRNIKKLKKPEFAK